MILKDLGYTYWDFGMGMSYKFKLGAKNLNRE